MLKTFLLHPILSARLGWFTFLLWYGTNMRKANLAAYYKVHVHAPSKARGYLDRHTLWTERVQYWMLRRADAETNLHLASF